MFSFNQRNKLPESLYVTIGSVSAISLGSQRPRCFNNIIRHHNEIIKNAVVIRNNSLSFRPSFGDERTFSVRAREKTMETVDWCQRKLRSQQRGKTLLGRMLVATTVIYMRQRQHWPFKSFSAIKWSNFTYALVASVTIGAFPSFSMFSWVPHNNNSPFDLLQMKYSFSLQHFESFQSFFKISTHLFS